MIFDYISLFSGCGFLDLACQWAGFKPVSFCEIDTFCQKILRKHWPDIPIIKDVKDVKGEQFKDRAITLIVGGFPCQDVSLAGQRRGISEGTRSGLWLEYKRIIGEIRPEWALVENVPGLLSVDNGNGFRGILRDLSEMGYDAEWCTLRASYFGAIHGRARIFIIAYPNSYGMEGCRVLPYISQNRSRWKGSQADLFNQKQFTKGYSSESESELLRADDGGSYWVDRIKGIGNGVCPQEAYPILKTIHDIECLKK